MPAKMDDEPWLGTNSAQRWSRVSTCTFISLDLWMKSETLEGSDSLRLVFDTAARQLQAIELPFQGSFVQTTSVIFSSAARRMEFELIEVR